MNQHCWVDQEWLLLHSYYSRQPVREPVSHQFKSRECMNWCQQHLNFQPTSTTQKTELFLLFFKKHLQLWTAIGKWNESSTSKNWNSWLHTPLFLVAWYTGMDQQSKTAQLHLQQTSAARPPTEADEPKLILTNGNSMTNLHFTKWELLSYKHVSSCILVLEQVIHRTVSLCGPRMFLL